MAAKSNPLAVPMQLRHEGKAECVDRLRARLGSARHMVLFIHGSCMNDLQWSWKGIDYGQRLSNERVLRPLYLRYNSDLHISHNGQQLTHYLERLFAALPAWRMRLGIVAHSMGGLVARSACYYADIFGHLWRNRLGKLICLGSPHHGAALERIGNWVDYLSSLNVYARPFSKLVIYEIVA